MGCMDAWLEPGSCCEQLLVIGRSCVVVLTHTKIYQRRLEAVGLDFVLKC